MSTNATQRWRAAALAVLAVLALALAGCDKTSPSKSPGTTQQPGGGY